MRAKGWSLEISGDTVRSGVLETAQTVKKDAAWLGDRRGTEGPAELEKCCFLYQWDLPPPLLSPPPFLFYSPVFYPASFLLFSLSFYLPFIPFSFLYSISPFTHFSFSSSFLTYFKPLFLIFILFLPSLHFPLFLFPPFLFIPFLLFISLLLPFPRNI